jgi:hypothetical protein
LRGRKPPYIYTMSTTKRVFAKLSAQEPMKVELGLIQDLDSKFNRAAADATGVMLKIQDSSKELSRISSVMRQNIQEAKSALKDAEALGADAAVRSLSSFIDVFEKKSMKFESAAKQCLDAANAIKS